MAFTQGYTFGFAVAVCVVCSLAVSSVAIGLRDLQQANQRRDGQNNVLQALGLTGLSGEAVDEAYASQVEERVITLDGQPADPAQWDLDGDGSVDLGDVEVARQRAKATQQPPELLAVFVRLDDQGEPLAYALPLYGNGLWGPISGYLALDPGVTEVVGATFAAPKETPGLGAEIMEAPFQDQWAGKRIVDEAGQIRTVRVVKGEAATACRGFEQHCVDGVSGATITARGVDIMVEQALGLYEPYLNALRGQGS